MDEIARMESRGRSRAANSSSASAPQRQAILVLGMHRSGTSAIAGAITALGAAGPKITAGPDDWNAQGYFESPRLFTALDAMLASAGSRWDDWRQLDPQWLGSEPAVPHRQTIKTLLIEEFGNADLIMVKDPRICRCVPFMASILAALNFSPVAVLPVRNPIEVACSLQRRDKFALSKSMLLWLRHVLDAEFHSRHMPRCLLSYEGFLADWRSHADRAAATMGVRWPDRSDRSDDKIDRFLAVELRHERASLDDIKNHPKVPPLVCETYDILTAIIANGESREWLDRLDMVRSKFDEGCRIFGPLVTDLTTANETLRAECDALAAARDSLRAERAERAERDAPVRDDGNPAAGK